MPSYLKIENPGVAPSEAFTLLGASTKRSNNGNVTIGKFGTGNKQGIAVLLRNEVNPVIFAGNLKLEFGTRSQTINDGLKSTEFNRVFVNYSGKDQDGRNRSSSEDLGFVLEHGSEDWTSINLALREFVSNSIDRAYEEDSVRFARTWSMTKSPEFLQNLNAGCHYETEFFTKEYKDYQSNCTAYENVTIEIVNENQVRAKSGTTRIFVPLTSTVLEFYNNLGKWFLHFSQPELLNQIVLPKKDRNFGERKSAVIYRRGVRVREFESSNEESLFDYNLENLKLDESRRVDDWYVKHEAAKAFSNSGKHTIKRLFTSFVATQGYWEHSFDQHGLEDNNIGNNAAWLEAFSDIYDEKTVFATRKGGEMAARKGYKVIEIPESYVNIAEKRGLKTATSVLSLDELLGREILDATKEAQTALDYLWNLTVEHKITNGKLKPELKTFRKIMDGASQTLGYYKQNTIFINQDIAGNSDDSWNNLNQQLLVTVLEELVHHNTGSLDNSRDFQDYCLNLTIYLAKELFNS